MAKKKSSAQCSAAGKALAECRWGKPGQKKKKKPAGTKKPKAKAKVKPRKSRRLAGQGPVRGPEPPKKPRAKGKKKKVGGKSSKELQRIENIISPGLNPGKNANKNWLAEQRRIWGA